MGSALEIAEDVSREQVVLAHDPQTSGGLLAALPSDVVDPVREALGDAGVEHWVVGRVEAAEGDGARLRLA